MPGLSGFTKIAGDGKRFLWVIGLGVALALTPGLRNGGNFDASAIAAGLDDQVASPDVAAAQKKIDAKDYNGAIALLTQIVASKPDDADANNLLGYSLRKTGKWQEAETFYLKALAKDAKHLGANEYLGELYAERGDLAKARERLKVLEAACGTTCEQSVDLKKAIEAAEAKK